MEQLTQLNAYSMSYQLPGVVAISYRNRGVHPQFGDDEIGKKDAIFLDWIERSFADTFDSDHFAVHKAGYEWIHASIKKDVDEQYW